MTRLRAWYDARRGARAVLVGWLVTRAVVLIVFGLAERFMVGDVFYYWRKIAALFTVGLDDTLYEYPTPVVWILWLPYGASFGSRAGYLIGFMVVMLLLDAAFTYLIWRADGRHHGAGVDFWLAFVLLVGALAYLRFDLIPAVLAGAGVLAARRRPGIAGALTAVGAAIKLWPALLIGPLLAPRRGRGPMALTFVGVGFGLALVSLLLGGWTRLLSPLTWQSDRDLQIESVWATPLLLARIVRPSGWSVAMSRYQAYEIFGPGTAVLVTLSTLATLLGIAVIVALTIRGFRHQPDPIGVGFAVLAVVAVMIVTNKTLSPQYLLWLGGPMAALLVLAPRAPGEERAAVRRVTIQLLLLAGLTQLVYPLLYDGLLGHRGTAMVVIATLVTAARNIALVVFTVEICRLAWRFAKPPARSTAARTA